MSAWSDAGWPNGIFFANPRRAINLIVEAANELRGLKKMTAIDPIGELVPAADLRDHLYRIDRAIYQMISGRNGLLWDYDRVGSDRAWFPTWVVEAIGDCPRIENAPSIYNGPWLLRWVISRYKLLNCCNRFEDDYHLACEIRGGSVGVMLFNTETERTAFAQSMLAITPTMSGSLTLSCGMRYVNGLYVFDHANTGRIRVSTPSTGLTGSGRYVCAAKVSSPYAVFDAGRAPAAAGALWWSPASDIVSVAAPVDVVLWTYVWEYPYSLSPGQETVNTGFRLETRLSVDYRNRRYYDPPEVWQ